MNSTNVAVKDTYLSFECVSGRSDLRLGRCLTEITFSTAIRIDPYLGNTKYHTLVTLTQSVSHANVDE